jgi:hypothetical protein
MLRWEGIVGIVHNAVIVLVTANDVESATNDIDIPKF